MIKPLIFMKIIRMSVCLMVLISSSQAFAQGHIWVTKTPMPTARCHPSVGVIDNKLYVAGGILPDDSTSFMGLEVYDPVTDSWTNRQPMQNTLYGTATGVIGGKLYVAGGGSPWGNINALRIYEPVTDTWSIGAPMPQAGSALAGAVIGGKLYVVGGANPSNTAVVNTLYVYDPATDTWTTKAPMPTARAWPGAGVINGKLYVIGGTTTGENGVDTVEAYDPETETWSTKAHLLTARQGPGIAVVGGTLYALGGTAYLRIFLTSVETYDPTADSWTMVDPMPEPHSWGAFGVIDNVIYAVGGYYRSGWPNQPNGIDAANHAFIQAPPPLANAGPNQTVHQGAVVTLDASGSSDPDGNLPLTYLWSVVSMPADSTVTLSDPTALHPTFTADQVGDFVIQLVVTNSVGVASAAATASVSTYNTPPVADAGQDQATIRVGTPVQLDGSQSYDVDGDPITYSWSLVSIPTGSNAALTEPTTTAPTFVADVHGTYVIQLIVSDPWVTSAPKTATVSFTNIKPVANAGTGQIGVVGDVVPLDGSGSYDANLDPLTYQWGFALLPPGSYATVTNPTAVQAFFVPDQPGTYVAQLIVNDGFVNSDPSTVQVQVLTVLDDTLMLLRNLVLSIGSLSPQAFKNSALQNSLINQVQAVTTQIQAGAYHGALSKLQNDIMAKTDGCAASGVPDKNDWITTCAEQNAIYSQLKTIVQRIKELVGE
jgi:N-acetylneuraminic acid mutarotase